MVILPRGVSREWALPHFACCGDWQKSRKYLGPLRMLEVWPERTASGTGQAPSMRISVPHQGSAFPEWAQAARKVRESHTSRPSRASSAWSSIRSLSRKTGWSSATSSQQPRLDCNHTRDKLASYAAAKREVMAGVEHRQHKSLNNRAENSHQPTCRRERQMKRFKSARQAQCFLSAHDQINNLFHLRRDHVSSTQYRALRTQAFHVWAEVSGVAAAA